MVLKLYFDFLSQPSRALYIFLKSCNIQFEQHIVAISRGENRSTDYEEIHPFGRVPALEHDGLNLIESIAIVRYTAREFNVPDHWYPSSSKGQARVDEYLEWQHLNIRVFCSRYFLITTLFPMIKQKPPNPAWEKECKDAMVKSLDELENKWLKDKTFLIGDQISVADIFAACEVEQTRMASYDARQGRPRLARWLERVANACAPHYVEAHKQVDAVVVRLADRQPHKCAIDEIMDFGND